MAAQTQVLIFEDDADADRRLLHDQLQDKLKEKVKIVTDAKTAWDHLNDPANGAEDLVALFLDLEAPNQKSLELLARLRKNSRLAHLHIVGMTTASTPKDDLAKCIELNVITFVEKPITIRSFTKAVADSFHSSALEAKKRG